MASQKWSQQCNDFAGNYFDDCFDDSHCGRFPPVVHLWIEGRNNSVLDSDVPIPTDPPVIKKPFQKQKYVNLFACYPEKGFVANYQDKITLNLILNEIAVVVVSELYPNNPIPS